MLQHTSSAPGKLLCMEAWVTAGFIITNLIAHYTLHHSIIMLLSIKFLLNYKLSVSVSYIILLI